MKKLRAPGIIELRTSKMLMIRQNDIGYILELNFFNCPGYSRNSGGVSWNYFFKYLEHMGSQWNYCKKSSEHKNGSIPNTQLFQYPEHSMKFFMELTDPKESSTQSTIGPQWISWELQALKNECIELQAQKK